MEERLVRGEQIRLIKYDTPEVNIRYTGRSKSMRALDSDKLWQIQLEYKVGDVVVSTYALMGEFSCTWNDRASYFPAPTPDAGNPLNGTLSVSGTFTTSGLKIAGLITTVTINDATWTALPGTPLANRNAISVQNESAFQVRYNYNPLTVGYKGVRINADGERFLDVTESIILYAKASPGSGSVDLIIEELS